MIDETHDVTARSWVAGADAHADFPVQNLPFGIYSLDGSAPKTGVAIGDFILDLERATNIFAGRIAPAVVGATRQSHLNALFALEPKLRRALRRELFALLTNHSHEEEVKKMLSPASSCRMHLPILVRDYTDFYAGIHHARAVGSLLRPDDPLLPNYKYVPVGYHGRSSSIRVSGTDIVRPEGQVRSAESDIPILQPSRRLDYEVELAIWAGGHSELGEPIPIDRAWDHIAGFSLLNDWSARDIQAWEYQPLGPFLSKNFASTVSAWVVTAEALSPFRTAQASRPAGDPAPLPYLFSEADQNAGAFDILIEVSILTKQMRDRGDAAYRLGHMSATHLYWTPAQLVTHHSVNGCDLTAGDLLGSGTISGPDDTSRGSLMELTRGGTQLVTLPDGETRAFLEDGDQVIMTAAARRTGYRTIGFGTCSAAVMEKGR